MRNKVEAINEALNETYLVYRETINYFIVTKQLSSMIDETSRTQREIINLLIDINHNKINPTLLKPHQLQNAIMQIKDRLTNNVQLPGKKGGIDLQIIYKLLEANGIFVGTKLIISAKIPLLSIHPSSVYEVIPLSIKKGDTMIIPKISKTILLYNFDIDSYHLMTQTTFNKCIRISTNKYICKGNWPWQDANDSACEIAPIKPTKEDKCEYDEVSSTSIWITLNGNNRWLFKTIENSSAHLQCPSNKNEILQLPKQGILNLQTGCKARIKGTTLIASNDQQTTKRCTDQ
ncbi:uncharacterized protein LOC119688840 [Teleopsis dalmanni]|uniref:uncharacterized protein LOC119688840 n=1 Tax=Teleopsis dalmanni TaxID=139649 RepID=UPI0018CE8DD9|nr:uncharacterized protein LOC119688840 [Teleopsis dalmanni]